MKDKLVIEVGYSGLGDHLFHSHIPRIAKEHGYKKVFVSMHSKFVNKDYLRIVWDYNPYVDGFTNDRGEKCDIASLVKRISSSSEENLLDAIMLDFGFDNGRRGNSPEVYYKPQFKAQYKKRIYDPNFLSWIGLCTAEDAMTYFKKNNITFDAIMKLREGKHLYIPSGTETFIETPTLEDFCDLIFSSSEFYCLTSGAATLASALGKKATVFFGKNQEMGYQHDFNHTYLFIPKYLINRFKRKFKL